ITSLNALFDNSLYKGYGLPRWSEKLNHLTYADDTIIFTSADKVSLDLVMEVPRKYEEISGKPGAKSSTQKANPLLSLARDFELETSNMEVPSPNHWATPKKVVQQVEKDQLKDKEEFENKKAKTPRKESGQQKSNANRSSFQHKQKRPAPSFASALAPRNKCEYNSQNSQNFRGRPAHSQGSKAQGGTKTFACAKCGRIHSGMCRDDSTSCLSVARTAML
ncbi:hypothetical protein MTR67_044398, partial [Solanum verrucosum]